MSEKKKLKEVIHEVKMAMPSIPLGRAQVELKISYKGGVLGTLKISKGGLEWVSNHGQKGKKHSWTKFAKFMEEDSDLH